MADPKKKTDENQMNSKIQKKFDLIFNEFDKSSNETMMVDKFPSEHLEDENTHQNSQEAAPKLDLGQDETGGSMVFESAAGATSNAGAEPSGKLMAVPDDNGLDFSLDFSDEAPEAATTIATKAVMPTNNGNTQKTDIGHVGMESDSDSELDSMFDAAIAEAQNELSDKTQKTIVFNKSQLAQSVNVDLTHSVGTINTTADLLTTAEAKANIESTIMDILRPQNLDSTQEYSLQGLNDSSASDADELGTIVDGMGSGDFGEFNIDSEVVASKDSSLEFNLNEVNDSTDINAISSSGLTDGFDISSVDFSAEEKTTIAPRVQAKVNHQEDEVEDDMLSGYSDEAPLEKTPRDARASFISDEDSTRVQATIRQLRDERDEFLKQIKALKSGARELEQDNLTLKAALDESKIEISILRKRHMVELEDIRYRMSVNEEKRAMAEEKAKVAEGKREKLEQRIRIDFSQVKQREKELETKLEMLSIDVDSQVNSRDQKILELRRKIDSLEFNMENVSIREQKSLDDKRKLEDKLNKMMKTLRHSIKNLEDDVDQSQDEAQNGKTNDHYRSGKT